MSITFPKPTVAPAVRPEDFDREDFRGYSMSLVRHNIPLARTIKYQAARRAIEAARANYVNTVRKIVKEIET